MSFNKRILSDVLLLETLLKQTKELEGFRQLALEQTRHIKNRLHEAIANETRTVTNQKEGLPV